MRVIIRVMKGLGHVGVGSEAPPNRVCCYLDFYKHTHTHTHTHTQETRLQILDLFHWGRTIDKQNWRVYFHWLLHSRIGAKPSLSSHLALGPGCPI